VWQTLALQPQLNGTLTGQYEVTDANNCNTSRTVTLARTGNVDIATIDDPSTRCMSYFYEARSAEPFVFTGAQWIFRYNAPVSCGSAAGPRIRIEDS
jgi:hypothetical protein